MKTLFIIAITCLFTASLCMAQEAAAPAAAPAAKAAPAKKATITGEITAVDTTANTITIKEAKGGAEETVTLTADTKLLSGGKATKITALKVGEKVTVTKKGDVVEKVMVTPAKKEKAAK